MFLHSRDIYTFEAVSETDIAKAEACEKQAQRKNPQNMVKNVSWASAAIPESGQNFPVLNGSLWKIGNFHHFLLVTTSMAHEQAG